MSMIDSALQSAALDSGLPCVAPETIGLSAERLARIKPVMGRYIDEGHVSCLLTAVARHGKLAHFECQGFADIERKSPLTFDGIFRIYSMTKPITAVAVMIAYEEGLFFLDDPVADYLPEFRNIKAWADNGPVAVERPLTIRHLLTHTGGVSFYIYPGDPVSDMYRQADIIYAKARNTLTTEQYVKKIADLPLAFQPGKGWCYGESMEILGRLVEVASGQSYGEFLKRRLFGPLNMSDTDFYVPAEKKARLAKLYEVGPEGGIVAHDTLPPPNFVERTVQDNDYTRPPSFESGGAGLVGTACDYLRFAQMLLNRGELNSVRILSPTSVELIMSNHLGPEFGERPLASLVSPMTDRKGLGFGFCGFVVTDAITSGTGGSDGEYSWGGAANTHFWVDPSQDLIGMVFSQLISTDVSPIRARMQQMTYQAIIE